MTDLEELVDWLRTAPSTEWCGPMLAKAADAIERLQRDYAKLENEAQRDYQALEAQLGKALGLSKRKGAKDPNLYGS